MALRFLLDANLSPRVGRTLRTEFGIDLLSLLEEDQGHIRDDSVVEFARSTDRVIITQDRDFLGYFNGPSKPNLSVIYLKLPNSLRTIDGTTRVLRKFFADHSQLIVFRDVQVTVTEWDVRIQYFWHLPE